MSADQRGGGLGAALDRVGAELSERRTPVAMALSALALLMTYRGLHQPTHSYAAVGVAMLLVARAPPLRRPVPRAPPRRRARPHVPRPAPRRRCRPARRGARGRHGRAHTGGVDGRRRSGGG